jgi:ParB family chromosome partitioning protein
MVDEKQIAFIPAVELSYLSDQEQHMVELLLNEDKYKIDQNKAVLLKQNKGNLNMDMVNNILSGDKNEKEVKQKPVRIKPQIIKRYFKPEQDQKEIENIIEKALDNYFKTN